MPLGFKLPKVSRIGLTCAVPSSYASSALIPMFSGKETLSLRFTRYAHAHRVPNSIRCGLIFPSSVKLNQTSITYLQRVQSRALEFLP